MPFASDENQQNVWAQPMPRHQPLIQDALVWEAGPCPKPTPAQWGQCIGRPENHRDQIPFAMVVPLCDGSSATPSPAPAAGPTWAPVFTTAGLTGSGARGAAERVSRGNASSDWSAGTQGSAGARRRPSRAFWGEGGV